MSSSTPILSHPPWGASCAVLAPHPWKDNRAAPGLDSLVCNSLSAGLGWALLWLAGIGHSDLALPFETYPLFFFLTRYDDVKRDADGTVTDTAPPGAASLILPLPALGFFRQVHLLTRSHFSRDPLSIRLSPESDRRRRAEEDDSVCFANCGVGGRTLKYCRSQDPPGRTPTRMHAPGCGPLALPLLLLAAAALAEGDAKGLKESETPGNFMEDEQWLSSISQYSGKIKHWNRFRDVSLQGHEG